DNEHVSPVSLGLPGALPVINRRAVEFSARTGMALNCEVRRKSVFARKNYFYPDLPKGYQISQYDQPICENGYVDYFLDGQIRRVRIERAHMEEDAGKSQHQGEFTLINLNRAGVPLLEIVSGPDMRSPAEAAEYARTVRKILRYLDVCDGNLEEGSMRCDCNVSIRKKGDSKLGTKVELKNINSFRFIEKAIEYEIQRQIDCKETGEPIVQETRLYDSTKNRTFSMRSKEEAHDYRYFPDPDLLPVTLDEAWVAKIRQDLPELPLARAQRFQQEFGLPAYDSFVLTSEMALADYFEEVAKVSKNPKAASNWTMTELLRELNEARLEVDKSPIASKDLGGLIAMIDSKEISGKMAKEVFLNMWKTSKPPAEIVKSKGMSQITDSAAIEKIVDQVMGANAQAVADYRGGKDKLFGFFVGQVMKASKGQANPEMVNQVLIKKLKG
ncbi:MAG TPA: Asp-tRNA(Asn)/Glu-tRNA(Gln) amidotransferase subunit GatB, partial [Bdellovibrionales bacterium]|nr:Asp-tRNA(Asn)/Glu-tRNA(Gln) amidotransferase subunit GatB [Bdellovibrionales bacterium]